MDGDPSVVEYFGELESKCGYCKSNNSSLSHGLWGHSLTTADYQDLINRGWRRSGKYCYKPVMHRTCCPLYTIRCKAVQFKISKSQKKAIKKMHNFLAFGRSQSNSSTVHTLEVTEHSMDMSDVVHPSVVEKQAVGEILMVKDKSSEDEKSCASLNECKIFYSSTQHNEKRNEQTGNSPSSSTLKSHKSLKNSSGDLINSFQSPCKKAKEIRRERQLKKLIKSGLSENESRRLIEEKKQSLEKTIEDLLSEPFFGDPMHKLEVRLVQSDLNNPVFSETFEESHSVYQKYQMIVHKDNPEKCAKEQYTRFLVNSPLQYSDGQSSSDKEFGSFHQQYWLDNVLIAVGVIDILPYCVSSVYFYYDPDYSFLSLGTYAALREIAFTRELQCKHPDLQYYYMGFYIHSCPKMRYKGNFAPSFLLCPETYLFHPIEKCISKLDTTKYWRFEEDPGKVDPDGTVDLKNVMILYQRQAMNYFTYCRFKKDTDDEAVVRQYANLVGRKCHERMLLYLAGGM